MQESEPSAQHSISSQEQQPAAQHSVSSKPDSSQYCSKHAKSSPYEYEYEYECEYEYEESHVAAAPLSWPHQLIESTVPVKASSPRLYPHPTVVTSSQTRQSSTK